MTTAMKAKRGFASMSPERRKEICAQGGRIAHARGTAHQFTPEEARVAGRKGGIISHQRRREEKDSK